MKEFKKKTVRVMVNIVCCFVPTRNARRKLRRKLLGDKYQYYTFKIPQSKMAHRYLDGLRGVEIGGSLANSFELDTLNVDYTDELTIFQELDSKLTGLPPLKVDIVANGDELPFGDNEWDFVINSHVLEHFFDPIKAVKEWMRVIKPDGYLYMIVPHKRRTFDINRDITPLSEIIARHNGELKITDYAHNEKTAVAQNETKYILIRNGPVPQGYERLTDDNHQHWNVWDTESFLEFMKYMKLNVVEYQDTDDKVGNGFAIVVKK